MKNNMHKMHTEKTLEKKIMGKWKTKKWIQTTMKRLGRTVCLEEYQKLMKLLHFVRRSISIYQAIHHLLPEKQHQQLPWPCQSEHKTVQN